MALSLLDHRVAGADEDGPGHCIDKPDLTDAHIEEVADSLTHAMDRVGRRKNLDAKNGRRANDLLARRVGREDANVRDAESIFADLDAKFRDHVKAPVLAVIGEEDGKKELQLAVIAFAQVSLLDLAFDVIDVGAIGGAEVLADRDELSGRHRRFASRAIMRLSGDRIQGSLREKIMVV